MAAVVVHNWSEFVTAVGTAGAEVEFPKNLVRTSDTDVDPNKLYTDANGVVQTNVQPSDLANLYENTFTLDADDYAPGGLTASISVSCASINGYGGTIKKIYASGVYAFELQSTDMQAIAFIDNHCQNYSFFRNLGNSGTATNIILSCQFNGGITNSYCIDCFNYTFYKCSFNVKLTGDFGRFSKYTNNYNNCKYDLCRINLIDDREFVSVNWGAQQFRITNSYVSGRCCCPIGVNMSGNYGHDIFDITAPSVGADNRTIGQYVFVNTDKASSISYTVPVTTATLSDANALAALGLPIQT